VLKLHSVLGVTFFESTVLLSTQAMDWKDTFHSLTVNFGISGKGYTPSHLRRDISLQARDTKSTTSSTTLSASFTSTTSQSFPVAPTGTPSATSVTKDLSFSELNAQIFPPTFSGAGLIT
jgi:hypothetical protein